MPAGIHHARPHHVGRRVSGAPGLAHAQRLPRRPAAGGARGLSTIVAVYRTDPVMVVGETAEGALQGAPSPTSPTCTSACPRGSGRRWWSSIMNLSH